MSEKRWTVGKKLWLLASLSLGVLVAIVFLNNRTIHDLSAELHNIGRTQLPAVRAVTLADMMHDGLRAVVYRALIAVQTKNQDEFLETQKEYAEFSKEIREHLESLNRVDVGDDVKVLVAEALPAVEAYVAAGAEVIALTQKGSAEEAIKKLPDYQVAFKGLEVKLEKLGELVESRAMARVDASEEVAKLWGLLVAGIGALLNLVISIWVNRDLVRTLRKMAGQLNEQGSALQVHTESVRASSESLSSASTEQSAAVQETASAMEQISAMVAKTADNSSRMSQSVEVSRSVVDQGRTAVDQMLTEMDTINAGNEQMMSQIEDSNQQIQSIVRVIGEISEKTKVINDIVFQTKLLSFNASVEAARAGENGKGFAVVAEEVGNLAQMSGSAAREITDMLEQGTRSVTSIIETNRSKLSQLMQQSTQKIEQGKNAAGRCGEVFSRIVEQVAQVSQLTDDISTAIREQRTGLDEIGKAINLFNESAQMNSATAQSTSDVAENLKRSFDSLQDLMHALDALVGSANEPQKVSRPASQSDEVDSLHEAA